MISISIVSHGQMSYVELLLSDMQKYCSKTSVEVILTLNIPESFNVDLELYSFPVRLIENKAIKGFGANHNQAFEIASGEYFCVLNPDVRFKNDPFPSLLNVLNNDAVGVVAPLVLAADGSIEVSARKFPSPISVMLKALGVSDRYENRFSNKGAGSPDWVAGMFMFFTSQTFRSVKGFDPKYFLYYEDVDLCARLRCVRKCVVLCTESEIIHLAQRASHRNLRYFFWHITSMLRFFISKAYWRMLWR